MFSFILYFFNYPYFSFNLEWDRGEHRVSMNSRNVDASLLCSLVFFLEARQRNNQQKDMA